MVYFLLRKFIFAVHQFKEVLSIFLFTSGEFYMLEQWEKIVKEESCAGKVRGPRIESWGTPQNCLSVLTESLWSCLMSAPTAGRCSRWPCCLWEASCFFFSSSSSSSWSLPSTRKCSGEPSRDTRFLFKQSADWSLLCSSFSAVWILTHEAQFDV